MFAITVESLLVSMTGAIVTKLIFLGARSIHG